MSEQSRGPGWWIASDGKWYAPELHPDYVPPSPPPPPPPSGFAEEPTVVSAPPTAAIPIVGPQADATSQAGSSGVASWYRRQHVGAKVVIWVGAAIVVLGIIGAFIPEDDDDLSTASQDRTRTTQTTRRPASTTTTREVPETTVATVAVAPTTPAPVQTAPPAASATMPAIRCGEDLQRAQNIVQEHGVFFSRSEDATGQGRSQIIDSNWVVVGQSPDAGQPIGEGDAVFYVVKTDEFSGC